MNDIPDYHALRAYMGQVGALAERKMLRYLDRHCRAFIGLSPFLVLATADTDGRADASPRGDPAGFVEIINDRTLLLPDRPGNNRVDSFSNVVSAPGVGLIFFVPGIDETLRVNGLARLVTEPDMLAPLGVNGKIPRIGLVIEIEEAFFHCGKALKRSRLWDPASRIERASFPSLGRVIADQISGVRAEDADEKLEKLYRENLY